MPFEIEWIRDQRVVYYQFIDPLNLADLEAQLVKMKPIYDSSSVLIHRIIDGTRFYNPPPRFMMWALNNTNLRHPMSGVTVVITTSPLITSIAHAVSRVSPSNHFIIVRTQSHAFVEIDRILAQEKQTEKNNP
jgi:hypothetical protein